MIGNKIK